MYKIIISVIFSIFVTCLTAQVETLNFDQLEPRLSTSSDTLFLVNFWATWCVPCVKELPEFEKINERYSDKKVKVILVSLDNPRHMESRLLPFIDKHNLKSEIVLLDDTRSNIWIPMVDESWSGAIPATIIFNSENRSFYEQVFTYSELERIVDSRLN